MEKIEIHSDRILDRIYVPCKIREALLDSYQWYDSIGIIDTGAQSTCISTKLAKQLKMKSIAECKIEYALGSQTSDVYVIDLIINSTIRLFEINVCDFPINLPFGIIIGMDILSKGSFLLKNEHGTSYFSFKISNMEMQKINQEKREETLKLVHQYLEVSTSHEH